MSARARQAYDRWRDAEGTHISDGCRVVQVAVAKEHGGLRSRLGATGTVVGRTQKGNRLLVRFDGEPTRPPVGIRSHLLRVQPGVVTLAWIIADLAALRQLLPQPE